EFNSFNVSFTEAAAGTQEPLGYLVLISEGAITNPTDGIEVTADTDLSDGDAAIYISYGAADEIQVSTASEKEDYTVNVYSYTNSGDNIDYKTDNVPTTSVSTNAEIFGTDFESISTLFDIVKLSVHNVSGSNDWGRDDFSSNNFAEMTEFEGEGVEEDWMVIGPINMDVYTSETFSFISQANFVEGSPLSVKVSTDFDGDVGDANWTPLTVNLSSGGFAETYSGLIDISAVSGQAYIAFVYEENETVGFEANGLYQIDDIKISGTEDFTQVATLAAANASTDLILDGSATTTGDVIVNSLGILDGEILVVSSGNTVVAYGDVILGGEITVQSGGSFIHYGDATDAGGSFSIERSTTFSDTDGQYSVMGGTTSGANTGVLGDFVFRYNETTPYGADGLARFEAVAGQSMTPGVGYFTANTGDITFTGIPNTGGYVVGVTNTGTTADDGFNLVANPYTSGLDFLDFIDINTTIEGSIYIWDDGGSDEGRRTNSDYITVNDLGVASGGSSRASDWDGTLRSGQGFFVRVPSGTDVVNTNVVFTNDMRVRGSNSDAGFFRQESNSRNDIVRLSIGNGKQKSDMLIGFRADATAGADRRYDALKYAGNTDLQIYSIMNDNAYAIQGLPLLARSEQTVELGFDAGESGTYTISADEIIIPAEYAVILNDKQLGLSVNLSDLGSYTFTTNTTVNNRDRFEVSFRTSAVTSIQDEVSDKLLIYTDTEHVNIALENGATIDQFTVYTLSGQVLTSGVNSKDEIKLKKGIFTTGVNIIKAESGSSSYTIKFILD
ncbi:MAG: hypothetical protein WBA74_16420, partial [Cyclobacteriaceae bacterium]